MRDPASIIAVTRITLFVGANLIHCALVGGFIEATDIAAAALFLISPEARAVTGQIMTVDGGWSVTQAS